MDRLKLVTAPATYPVTAAEVKTIGKFDGGTDRDAAIDMAIPAATARIEAMINRRLIEQTWDLYLDAFSDEIELPLGPAIAVLSVNYRDDSDVEAEVDTNTYWIDTTGYPQMIVLKDGSSWPDVGDRPAPVRIRFTAGFDAALDPKIKWAVARTAAMMVDDPYSEGMPPDVMADLEDQRAGWFAA